MNLIILAFLVEQEQGLSDRLQERYSRKGFIVIQFFIFIF
jgi:hypothetical protein